MPSDPGQNHSPPRLEDGSRVGVIGGGPAGSFFSYFLLEMAARIGLEIQVDIYEPRDFSQPAPLGCNMCGGIVSESLVQLLAAEGIHLPPAVIQRGIDSYVLHTDVGTTRIDTPLHEMRIGAVHRGPGPRDVKEIKWASFDAHLLMLAGSKGARLIQGRVDGISRQDGGFELQVRGKDPERYDLLTVATGVNTAALKMLEGLDLGYRAPRTTKAAIREYRLGGERIAELLGNSMHVFLLSIPRLEFGAIVPKGDYATVCLLGEDIDNALLEEFLNCKEVVSCLPPESYANQRSCQCGPRMNVGAASQPYADRLLFLGDCGVTRLYKDGIGGAYRASKAAARTAVFEGIAASDFESHYWPVCQAIETDNRYGRVTFALTREIQRRRFARRALLKMTRREQKKEGHRRRMSAVLWNTFTGSEPYRDIFLRTLHPGFLGWFLWDNLTSLLSAQRKPAATGDGS